MTASATGCRSSRELVRELSRRERRELAAWMAAIWGEQPGSQGVPGEIETLPNSAAQNALRLSPSELEALRAHRRPRRSP
jgi:hypothetical protein